MFNFTQLKSRTLTTGVCVALAIAVGGCQPKRGEPVAPEPGTTPEKAPSTDEPVAKAPGRDYPTPPPADEMKPLSFPDVSTFSLSNDLAVYVVENHEIPIVSAQLVVRCGVMDEEYVAPFTAMMLAEGTRSRSKAKMDEAIESVGGSIESFPGVHVSYVTSRVLKRDLKLAMTLMADRVVNPTFPPEALEKQKEQAKTALGFAKGQPGVLAQVLFNSVAYPDGHPYGRPFPSNDKIDAIKIDDVRKFHETFYRANNAFLVLAGDITKAEAEPLVKRAFGRWKSVDPKTLPANPLNKFTDYKLPPELVVHVVDRPGSAQSEILVGNLALARNHSDWPKLVIANEILGDDANGRLFRDIREKRGLTYGIYSEIDEAQAPGTFVISTRTQTDTTGKMLAAIFEHIRTFRSETPDAEEVKATVRKAVGAFPLEIETPGQIAGHVREALIYNLPPDYWRNYHADLAGVTASDVREAARKYVHPVPHIVIVGTADDVAKQVKKVLPKAKVVRYNTELKRQ